MAGKIVYSEPKSYFNADMKKAAAAWEKQNKAQTSKTTKTAPKKSK